jgi:hypothetical protein
MLQRISVPMILAPLLQYLAGCLLYWGQGRLDLLSRRFLRAPRGDQAQVGGARGPSQVHAAAA